MRNYTYNVSAQGEAVGGFSASTTTCFTVETTVGRLGDGTKGIAFTTDCESEEFFADVGYPLEKMQIPK